MRKFDTRSYDISDMTVNNIAFQATCHFRAIFNFGFLWEISVFRKNHQKLPVKGKSINGSLDARTLNIYYGPRSKKREYQASNHFLKNRPN
jgi:hypothetical protein